MGLFGFGVFFFRFVFVLHRFVVAPGKRGLIEWNGTQGILQLCFCLKDFGRLTLLTLR